jgi:glycosyltransferase involved in cell wall biosynthesis
MRVCLLYDCLFPYTVGGAERWYRNLGERLAAAGHEVDYLTLRQWDGPRELELDGMHVVAVGPRMALYTGDGRRRILPPLVYGAGVLWRLLRSGGGYDVVHTASFPYFSLLAAALARLPHRFRLVVDWHEVWTRDYWREYLGRAGGAVGWTVQRLCARLRHRAFCFSRLHAARLREEGYHGEPTVLEGEYAGPLEPEQPMEPDPVAVFAGRHIPEKRAPLVVSAYERARRELPELRCVIYGDGPDRPEVLRLIAELGLEGSVEAPGFVAHDQLDEALRHALCLVLPSRREGYGMVVIEAASKGTPSVLVADPDNAAVELVEEGVNGFVAPSADPGEVAAAILRVRDGGRALRESTAAWFGQNAQRLSLTRSLERVVESYGRE